MSSSVRDITESTEAEGPDDTHQQYLLYTDYSKYVYRYVRCHDLSLFQQSSDRGGNRTLNSQHSSVKRRKTHTIHVT